jgi:3-isopropylmalate dehydrogenase
MQKRNYSIVLLPGDGIGPEVTQAAVAALDQSGALAGFSLSYTTLPVGGEAIDRHQDPLPDFVLEQCQAADAVLLGAVGGPKWDALTGALRPESGLLKLRKALGAFANLRPVAVPDALADASPLRAETVRGTDLLVVRELTGGIYFGEPRGREPEGDGEKAYNTMIYSTHEIDRVARVAFDWAGKRRRQVTSVDKANVLVVSQLWRDTVQALHAAEFSDMELQHLYIDNAAMQLVLNPRQFDVIVTGNLFGDILSDAAATLGGSLGLLPSASLGGPVGLFEPVHGSAPDIAGQGKANPVAAILSAGMLLDFLNEGKAAEALRHGVQAALDAGARTADLCRAGHRRVSTTEMSEEIQRGIADYLNR